MKATDVRILPALDHGESYVDPTFMLVETTRDLDGEPTTTIEHVTSRTVNGKEHWQVVSLGQCVPMSHAGALEWAVSFAASRDVPIVYQRDDTREMIYAALGSKTSPAAASSPSK